MRRLNSKEEQIMQILWKLDRAFVKEIRAEMEAPRPPITTVSSIVRKLESEGFINHENFGKTYRYFPAIPQDSYRKSTFRRLLDNYFGGSPRQLLSYFVEEEDVSPEEINQILEDIRRKEEEDKK